MNSKTLFILAFLLLTKSVFSQEQRDFYLLENISPDSIRAYEKPKIDSLLGIYHQSTTDSVKLKVLSEIVDFSSDDKLWYAYNEYMLEFCELRLEEADLYSEKEIRRLKSYFAKALNNKGYAYSEKGDVNIALKYYEESQKINLEIKDSAGIASTYNNIGYVLLMNGDIREALETFEQSLKIYEVLNNRAKIANCLNNIAYIYTTEGEHQEALKHFHRTLEIQQELDNDYGVATALGNIGATNFKIDNIPEAIEAFKKSLSIYKGINYLRGMVYSYNNLGKAFKETGNLDSALYYYKLSEELSTQFEDKVNESVLGVRLGELYMKLGNIDMAEEYATRSFELAQDLGFPDNIEQSAQLMEDVYKARNNWKGAYEMQVLHHRMRDSIINLENKEAIYKQNARFEYEKKEQELKLKDEKEKALFEERLKRDKIFIWSVSIVLGLTVIFLGFIIVKFRQSRKQQFLIDAQNRKLERAYEKLNFKNSQVIDSISYAKKLQQSIITDEEEMKRVFPDSFAVLKPKDLVSGDFFWCNQRGGIKYVAVVDCTGHGVPGAMISIVAHKILDKAVEEEKFKDPGEMLSYLNEQLMVSLSYNKSDVLYDGFDISLLIIDEKAGSVLFAGAHNYALHVKEGNPVMIEADNFPIGLTYKNSMNKEFNTKKIEVGKDDMVYLFTDGYRDQFGGAERRKLYYKNFESILMKFHSEHVDVQGENVKEKFKEWKGTNEQIDDVCVVGIRF